MTLDQVIDVELDQQRFRQIINWSLTLAYNSFLIHDH